MAPIYSYTLIFHLDMGIDGAALAVDAVQLTQALILGGYTIWRDWRMRDEPHATWKGWSWEALRGWGTYLRYALPSVAMLCCEWWTFEAVIIVSAHARVGVGCGVVCG